MTVVEYPNLWGVTLPVPGSYSNHMRERTEHSEIGSGQPKLLDVKDFPIDTMGDPGHHDTKLDHSRETYSVSWSSVTLSPDPRVGLKTEGRSRISASVSVTLLLAPST